MKNETVRLGLTLMAYTAIAAFLLAGFNLVTAPKIYALQEERELAAQKAVLPAADSFQEEKIVAEAMETEYPAIMAIYSGLDEAGEPVGLVAKVAPKGYGGTVNMMVGVGHDGTITGLEILSHGETPGLGANIENPDFIAQFVGKQTGLLQVVKGQASAAEDISALASATISSTAVTEGVNQVLQYFMAVWNR